jgi:hypothetical protein
MSSVQAVRSRLTALLALSGLWLGLGFGLSFLTRRVADWFVMTDELLYERLALSIARTHSVLPRVHTEVVSNLNQLYPILIAPGFRHGSVVHGFHEAHILNAFVMTSAILPVYYLARRVTNNWWLPFVVAVLSVSVPWLTLSSFLLSEVVAYPVFALALLALQGAVATPSVRNDLLAGAAIVLAVLARTQFYALAVALAAAIVLRGLLEGRLREALRAHLTLAVLYVLGGAAALGALLTGHHVLGSYSQTATGNPLPLHILDSTPAHVAIVALAGGLLPFLVGGAWIVANLRRSETTEGHAFAWVAAATIVTLGVEVTSFDLRFGHGIVRDRYLFYLVPVILVAFAAGLTAPRPPRWSLVAPLVVLVIGFVRAPLSEFSKLNADTPASVLDNWLVRELHGLNAARFFLVLAAVLLAGAFVEATILLPRTAVAVGACVLMLVALPAETAYAFKRLFALNGTSGLPLTLDQSVVFSWVDREITTNSEAVMVPYPVIRGDYWANTGFWWDLEFWNMSVDREAARPNQFSVTPSGSFPKIDPRFDPKTGLANFDVDSYVAQATADARFHIEGRVLTSERGVSLVFPDRPWRADWVSYGLYPDGWTRPEQPARFRVFPQRNQGRPLLRTLHLTLFVPPYASARPVRLLSNADAAQGMLEGTQLMTVSVCVPAHAPADVTLTARGSIPVEGDPSTAVTAQEQRRAGVLVSDVALDPPTPGATCSPSRGTR